MARIRTIKPKFWDDVKIGKLSRDARLLYIGMWTFCDDLGVIIAESIWLKSKIFPYDQIQIQQFERWIKELVQNGFISLLSVKSDKFYYLPKFTRHQLINRPNFDDVNICKELLDKELKQLDRNSLNNHGLISDKSVPIYREDKDIYNTPYNPPDGDSTFELEFEKFRKLYPGTKRGTETEFKNLKKKYKDWKTIIPLLIPALENEMNYHKIREIKGEFVPQYRNLSTWINNRCWEQEFKNEQYIYENNEQTGMQSVYKRRR